MVVFGGEVVGGAVLLVFFEGVHFFQRFVPGEDTLFDGGLVVHYHQIILRPYQIGAVFPFPP